MQRIIAFLIDLVNAFVSTCMNNELLCWFIYLFVFGAIIFIFSALWRK